MKTEYAMSKTAALKKARTHVGEIIRRSSTDYVFYAPYRTPGGPTTEKQADSYWKARAYRTAALVQVALDLMEVPDTDLGHEDGFSSPSWEIDRAISYLGITNAQDALNYVLQQIEKGSE